jgi:polysaccharide deacetylase 2 family uncharacterized protein YibQ
LSNRRKKRNNKYFKKNPTYYINLAVILFFLALIVVLSKIFIFDNEPKIEETKKVVPHIAKVKTKPEDPHHKYEEKTKALEIEYVDEEYSNQQTQTPTSKIKSEDTTKKFSFFDEVAQTKEPLVNVEAVKNEKKQKIEDTKKIDKIELVPKKEVEKKPISTKSEKKELSVLVVDKSDGKKGKLSIVIDDVTTKTQFNKISNIGYPITMAFLPPTKTHKDSANIAQELKFYMVHLPLEATTRSAEEAETLHVGDDIATIEDRIKQLKSLYPKAVYFNNHTGSKFTEDENSMDMLMQVLKNNNLIFVDSRTSSKTVAKKYANKYGMRYIARNIFLDNTPKKEYIQEQLQKAVNIAKKTGSAIAIGHPYGATLETLKESKALLDGVDIVLIDKI